MNSPGSILFDEAFKFSIILKGKEILEVTTLFDMLIMVEKGEEPNYKKLVKFLRPGETVEVLLIDGHYYQVKRKE